MKSKLKHIFIFTLWWEPQRVLKYLNGIHTRVISPGKVSCTNADTHPLQRLKKLSASKKKTRSEGARMQFHQFDFGLNTETALHFTKNRLVFCFKFDLFQALLLQKAASPQTNPVQSYWQLAEVHTKDMFWFYRLYFWKGILGSSKLAFLVTLMWNKIVILTVHLSKLYFQSASIIHMKYNGRDT